MSNPIRILELRSVRGTGGGPEKTILMGAQRSDPNRFAVTVCYLRDARDEVFGIDRRADPLGIDYVEVVERHSFDRAIWRALHRVDRERPIDIEHGHDYKTNQLAALLARSEGTIPVGTSTVADGYAMAIWIAATPSPQPISATRAGPTDKRVCTSGSAGIHSWVR